MNAVSNSVVPKFTIIIGNSYGAGNYAMCGKAYDPRFIISWPWAELAVMGGVQAAKVLAQIQETTLTKQGKQLTEEDKNAILKEISEKYQKQTEATYSASRLWVDAIIDPIDTRKWISMGINAANHSPITERFNLGVMQV